MAHSKQTIQAVRASYIHEYMDLKAAAELHGVSAATAQRWKTKAKADGDDWDTARNSLLLAQGGKKELINHVLERFYTQSERIFSSIEEAENLNPKDMVQLMASWTDSLSKVNKLMGGQESFNKIGFALELLQFMAQYIRDEYPAHVDAFLEVIEPFGVEVSKRYG